LAPCQGLSRYQSKKFEGTMTTESRVDHRKFRRRADGFAQHVTEEIASLRAALDIQFKRIAQIQAELDLSHASPRVTIRPRRLLAPLTLSPKGNGHGV
jgi:hypothetical protein